MAIVAACTLLAMGTVVPASAEESAYGIQVIDQSGTTLDGGNPVEPGSALHAVTA